MSAALIHGVPEALAAAALEERQERALEHGRSAQNQQSQTVRGLREVMGGRQHCVVPANLPNQHDPSEHKLEVNRAHTGHARQILASLSLFVFITCILP